VSLLQYICYPSEHRFRSPATDWGLLKQSIALCKYKEYVSSHSDISVDKCGLIINLEFAFLGASPDALVSHSCCGSGSKFPYNWKYQYMNMVILFIHVQQQVVQYIQCTNGDEPNHSKRAHWTVTNMKSNRLCMHIQEYLEMTALSRVLP
jgi:hypothetical protein